LNSKGKRSGSTGPKGDAVPIESTRGGSEKDRRLYSAGGKKMGKERVRPSKVRNKRLKICRN